MGEVVLRGTLSHRPALRCAAHGADAPFAVEEEFFVTEEFDVDEEFVVTEEFVVDEYNMKEPRLIFINRGSRSVATTYSSTW